MKELASPRKLLLDIDAGSCRAGKLKGKVGLKRVLANLRSIEHTVNLGIEWLRIERSSGGKGWHVIVSTRLNLAPIEQVAVQAIAGSDPVRERLNLMRAMSRETAQGRDDWQFLYGSKER